MLIDHIGAVLFPEMIFLRVIGRIAFPIFCFLLVEGFFHTGNIKKYLIRLALFAIIAEIPFDMTFFGELIYWQHQNVFITLFIGLGTIALYERLQYNRIWAAIPMLPLAMVLNTWLKADYGFYGVAMIVIFYFLHDKKPYHVATVAAFNLLFVVIGSMSFLQFYAVIALVFIWFYNGERGLRMKYFFYFFYPVHLIGIWAISRVLL